ncbi:hypothetical protein F5148DRAFT_1183007 [Russula earlei]|uniref:Uncharacterized protein n=1 Tax=Russula earlei TaxID=71964 RepID=A0ACC0UFF5_9AGAM|nr:hypothetical protein F5148DRAFT_1183007 [Russula earlei]
MPSYRRLQQFAIAVSTVSVIYNGAEGGLSIGFGAESGSRSLIFFGVQSGIEVISAILVLWRFRKIAKPGDEMGVVLGAEALKFEMFATLGIGLLLLVLAIATESAALATLVLRQEPDSSNSSLIISASALILMITIWLPKRFLAKALNSSTMQGEAICSLSCIQVTFVLFIGSLLFKVWKGGWWVDGATSIALGVLFAWEGVKMMRWARSDEFTGGCCEGCQDRPPLAQAELANVYRDMCDCCSQKEGCRNSDGCKCAITIGQHQEQVKGCCIPVTPTGEKCCSRKIIPSHRMSRPPIHDGADHEVQVPNTTSCTHVSVAIPVASPSSCCEGYCRVDEERTG